MSAPITPTESVMTDTFSHLSPTEIQNALDKKRKHIDSKSTGVIPRHIRRGMDVCDSILRIPNAIPVGHMIVAAYGDGDDALAEILNVETDIDDQTYYYVHFLGREKKEDDWFSANEVVELKDLESLRILVQEIMSKTSPDQSSSASQFFQLSQLTKQCTAGTSIYGPSSSSVHHDPHEFSPKTVRGIEFGSHRMKAWYRSPYPKEFWSRSDYLKVCDRCLRFSHTSAHACIASLESEGGTVVYDDGNGTVVYELDGQISTDFCVRLFLLAKLFLEDKRTSAVDERQISQVTPFLFYVLTVGGKFVGYFSKYKVQKKDSPILSCILVLPSEQRKGYGKLLISIAYELAKREGRQGSAERPLSGPGLAAFMSWWTWRLSLVLADCFDGDWLSIAQISDLSGMTSEDVVETLKTCGALKQWSGSGSNTEVKLRESGKRAKIKLTMDLYRCIGGNKKSGNMFNASKLNDLVRLCPVVASTPTK